MENTMRAKLLTVVGFGLFASGLHAGPPVTTLSIECNWGRLTMESIANGFPQGRHSSDPSGDGHGPGTVDEPRAGLANVVQQGNLEATCELIEGLMQP
jgi:hypothetical protein